jgi:transcriptional regulator with XRE-family HTH domain
MALLLGREYSMNKKKVNTLAGVLAEQREMNGTTLRELEKSTGLSNALISQIETGHVKNPSFRSVVLLARALELDLADLATYIES